MIFATLLACLEEAVTVTMTNLAPLFGSRIGEAFITASTNWLDVIAFHSVVVFVPYFIALALILTRYAVSPFAVFLSFGVVGTVSEAIFAGGIGPLAMFPMWAFVYGLMVWLPELLRAAGPWCATGGSWGASGPAGRDDGAGAADDRADRLCDCRGAGASGHRLCPLTCRKPGRR